MNTRFVLNRANLRLSLALLLLTGGLGGSYVFQSLVYAQNQKEAEGTSEMKKQMMCPMMAGLKGVDLYADSPTLLAARAEEMGLSKEQEKQLEEIAKSAREQARGILTGEQREALKKLPEGPLSMMEVAKLQDTGRMDKENSKGMCPMCMKMMNKKMQKAEEERNE